MQLAFAKRMIESDQMLLPKPNLEYEYIESRTPAPYPNCTADTDRSWLTIAKEICMNAHWQKMLFLIIKENMRAHNAMSHAGAREQ